MSKKAFGINFGKKHSKEKKKGVAVIKKIEEEVAEALETASEISKKKDDKIIEDNKIQAIEEEISKNEAKKNISNNVEGKIDPATGSVYYPLDSVDTKTEESIEKFVKPETAKAVDLKEQKRSIVRNDNFNFIDTFERRVEPLSSDITVVCIELDSDVEKIEKYIRASLKFFATRFYKFIFFGDNIYTTEIQSRANISEEHILKMVKTIKDINVSKNSNILLYDAIEETVFYTKESKFFNKRIVSVDGSKFILDERKYIFIISGNENNSCITKEEIQKVLSDVRKKDTDMHVVLTNPNNLSKIVSLGFRTIKSY